jgi:hypothetical protein
MSARHSGFGVGFSKEVDSILATVQLGAQMGEVYLYPHEVRKNLRLAGMVLDQKLEMTNMPDPYEAGYTPEFDEADEPEDFIDEGDADVN